MRRLLYLLVTLAMVLAAMPLAAFAAFAQQENQDLTQSIDVGTWVRLWAPVLVGIVSTPATAAGVWVAVRRYRQEVPSKGLSYFTTTEDHSVRIAVWNSGNAPIAEEDYLGPFGFDFGGEAQVRQVHVEMQRPEDLGIAVDEKKAVDSGNLEMPPIHLNPEDRFVLQMLLADTEAQNPPRPYGRIRGTHHLLKEVKRPRQFGQTEHLSLRTYLLFAFVFILAMVAFTAIYLTVTATAKREEEMIVKDYLEEIKHYVVYDGLEKAESSDAVSKEARFETLRLMDRLDASDRKPELKGQIVRYLSDMGVTHTGILRGADLSDANLSNPSPTGFGPRGGYLRGADLREVTLRGADLSDTDLTDADLTDADLNGATVTDEQLGSAKSLERAALPTGSTHAC